MNREPRITNRIDIQNISYYYWLECELQTYNIGHGGCITIVSKEFHESNFKNKNKKHRTFGWCGKFINFLLFGLFFGICFRNIWYFHSIEYENVFNIWTHLSCVMVMASSKNFTIEFLEEHFSANKNIPITYFVNSKLLCVRLSRYRPKFYFLIL